MEVIQTTGVKIPNSLLVSGLTDTEADEELYDFLKQYGSIQRRIPVDSHQSESGLQIIVEYTYGTALQSLSSLLLYKLASKSQANFTYLIKALASVYTPAVSQSATQTYLTELKEIAKQSGKHFADVLRQELFRISETVVQDKKNQEEDTETSMDDVQENAFEAVAQVSPEPSGPPPQHVHTPESDPAPSQRPPPKKKQNPV